MCVRAGGEEEDDDDDDLPPRADPKATGGAGAIVAPATTGDAVDGPSPIVESGRPSSESELDGGVMGRMEGLKVEAKPTPKR